MIKNVVLMEAVEEDSPVKTEGIVKAIRKLMNTAKLTKFKSANCCNQFYTAFFLSSLPDLDVTPTVTQWGLIYTELLSNDAFCSDLALYMASYQPAVYTGIFMPLWNLIQSELAPMKKDRVRYLSLTKGMIGTIQMRMSGVANLIKVQINDPNVIKFLTVVDQTLMKMTFDINALVEEELRKAIKPDQIQYENPMETPISETAQELIDLLENADAWIENRKKELAAEEGALDEGVVKNAYVRAKRAERDFEEFVMRKVRKLREERRNRKHAELVGEALRINRVIKRVMVSCAVGAVLWNPIAGCVVFLCSLFYDRMTDKKDRQVLVGQLKDEMEILEEKIQMAERNGDEKARIELIRVRQKFQREYERIMKVRFDAKTRHRMNV